MLPEPKLHALSDRCYELLEDYIILTSIGLITVKKGYQTDLASIPQWAWSILGVTPSTPKVIVPALIHDILYQTHSVSYLKANDVFLELCKANKMVIPRRFTMYKVLDMFGWIAYYSYDNDDNIYFKEFLKIVK